MHATYILNWRKSVNIADCSYKSALQQNTEYKLRIFLKSEVTCFRLRLTTFQLLYSMILVLHVHHQLENISLYLAIITSDNYIHECPIILAIIIVTIRHTTLN